MPYAITGALLLCILYVTFLVWHYNVSQQDDKKEEKSITARYEESWKQWLISKRTVVNSLQIPKRPVDEKGMPLPFPDPLIAVAFGEDLENIKFKESLTSHDMALLRMYPWFLQRFSFQSDKPAQTSLVWNDLPPYIREAEMEACLSHIQNFLSASIAWNLLKAESRPVPAPKVLFWMRNQAIYLLRNGYYQEGFAFLKELVPYLSAKDPEFDAWLGSATIMQAQTTENGLEKIRFVEEGMKILEKALIKGERNLSCLYIRAQTYLSLPEFYQKQHEQGVKDIEFLVRAVESEQTFFYTNQELLQEKTKIDSLYLKEIIEWALSSKNISPSLKRSLEKLLKQLLVVSQNGSKGGQ
ncbi:hypothetical protein [Treponema sp. J25]|uniref:hypothetical protein n=1 Tax=Treponema sp. J25 TaxID=2094121 RepID=UPI00104BFA4B|nr:hypothetical protein [Treponema sp. J25]